MVSVKRKILLFLKAQLSAIIASIIDFSVTLFCAEIINIWYVYSTFIGACSGGITNCITNYKWVFDHTNKKKKYIAMKYFIVWSSSILLNTLGTTLIKETTHINYILSKSITAIVVAIFWNYQMQRKFVFK